MPTFNYSFLLRWIRANYDKLDDLLILANELRLAAQDSIWPIIKKIGDLFDNSPMPDTGVGVFAVDELPALEAEVCQELASHGYTAQAWDGSRLRKLFDTLMPVLVTLLPIFLNQ